MGVINPLTLFLIKSGKGSLIIKPILLSPNCLSINNNVLIRNNARIEGIFEYLGQKYTPNITIGNNVNIEQNSHITCSESIVIGNNTAIAANVSITDTIHNYQNISINPKEQFLSSKKVVIGSNCTLYNNTVILPGSILGDNIVVAANSVVNGVFPSFCVIGGVPARILKQYNFKTKNWEK